MIRVGSADALGSRALAPQDQARNLLSEETWPKNVPHSFLGSAYLSEAMRMSWEGIPHHTEGTSEDTKIGPLFLYVVSRSKVTARRGVTTAGSPRRGSGHTQCCWGHPWRLGVVWSAPARHTSSFPQQSLAVWRKKKAKDNEADHSQVFYQVLMDQVHVFTVLIREKCRQK